MYSIIEPPQQKHNNCGHRALYMIRDPRDEPGYKGRGKLCPMPSITTSSEPWMAAVSVIQVLGKKELKYRSLQSHFGNDV